ncbi:MAG: glycerate kinase [Bacillota bacterium]
MKIVVAPDSFKESLTSEQACECIVQGIRRVFPGAEIVTIPMSDGGEGLVDTLVTATGGKLQQSEVTGPLGEKVTALWGVLGDGATAVIEMAKASGLSLVPPARRNPSYTTTRGTGELIRHALDRGCTRLVVGIGGSATNDGGAGMARALGVRFLDKEGRELPEGGIYLSQLHVVDVSGLDPRLSGVRVEVACDVKNPLCGPNGASYVYGPQKGADPDMVKRLDEALTNYAMVLERLLGRDVSCVPGSGAAGGLGAGLLAFLRAELVSGVELVLDKVRFDDALEAASLVITGEGKIDGQTMYGKVPLGVARRAARANVPVIAIGGAVTPEADGLYGEGVWGLMPSVAWPMELAVALGNARQHLISASERACRLVRIGMTLGVVPALQNLPVS